MLHGLLTWLEKVSIEDNESIWTDQSSLQYKNAKPASWSRSTGFIFPSGGGCPSRISNWATWTPFALMHLDIQASPQNISIKPYAWSRQTTKFPDFEWWTARACNQGLIIRMFNLYIFNFCTCMHACFLSLLSWLETSPRKRHWRHCLQRAGSRRPSTPPGSEDWTVGNKRADLKRLPYDIGPRMTMSFGNGLWKEGRKHDSAHHIPS